VARAAGPALRPGTSFELALTQEQLAARLGTVRELVARALGRLRRAGVIAQRRRRITILDPARLGALGRGEATLGRPERDQRVEAGL
jgi:CRP/FNR family transcriptional regulator